MSSLVPANQQVEVRKHVAAIHVTGELSLLERKLVNVLLLNAFDDLLDKRVHSISAPVLREMLGFDSKNTSALREALNRIMTTRVDFDLLNEGGTTNFETSTLVARAGIVDGVCRYEYSQYLSEKLANPEIYALININVQRRFSGGYALALFENCLRFKRVGSTGWISVDTWRRLLGADAAIYDEFKNFNAQVIKPAVREVNQVSNIILTPELQRLSRRVVAIRFLIEENPQASVYDAEPADHADIRASETFKRLTALGIGDRLAITWIQQEPDRALLTAEYVEDKAKRKQIKGSSGGYTRTIFEKGTDLTGKAGAAEPDAHAIEAARVASESAALEEKARRKTKKTMAAIKSLSLEARRELAQQYIAGGNPGTTYVDATVTFRDPIEKTAFTSWLHTTVAAQVHQPSDSAAA
jgi:hypothetical protein